MALIRVYIESVAGGKRHTANVPDNVTVSRLLPELVSKLGLPARDGSGRPISYRLLDRDLGRQLLPVETLAAAGVQADHNLKLLMEVVAGAILQRSL
jgi:hypothetical protein